MLQLACTPVLVISTPLQHLLNVDSRKHSFSDGGSSMISGFNKFTANFFGRNWTIEMLIQLKSHFRGSSPMLSSRNAFFNEVCRCKFRSQPESRTSVVGHFPCFLNSAIVVLEEKASSSAVLLTKAPRTICLFSDSVRSRILT